MKPPTATIYTRVSTKDKGQTTESQSHSLIQYCLSQGWSYILIEESQSAVRGRPKFDRILSDIASGKIKLLLAYKMDRLARSVPDFVNFISLVNRYHVRVIIPSQGIDTDYSNPANKMMMNMLATIAEFEHDLISERVKTGMDRAKREGKILGRPRTVIDKLRVKEMREQGLTIRMIAARLKVGKIAVERVVREIRKEEEKCTLV